MFSPLEQFDALRLISIKIYYEFSFFNTLLPMIILIGLFTVLLALLRYNFSLIPFASHDYVK